MAQTLQIRPSEVPTTYQAVVYDNPGSISTKIVTQVMPEPGPGQVLVRLTHSGVCGSDLAVMKNSWQILPHLTQPGQIGGHEGVGIVQKLGPGTETANIKLGDRVGIKWVASICHACAACREGADGVCFNQKISGYYFPGTFQQYALASADYVTPIPDAVESAAAAPLLCAGVTAYAALRKSGARKTQWVVISGAGGGIGHLACQIGSGSMGYRILAIDDGSKETLARACGADVFLDVGKHDSQSMAKAVQAATGDGAAAVIVCTSSKAAYNQAMSFLRFGGTMVCVGVPGGEQAPIATASPGALILKQFTILGSVVGSQRDALDVLDLAAQGLVKAHYRIEKMSNLNAVLQKLDAGTLTGRVVLDLA